MELNGWKVDLGGDVYQQFNRRWWNSRLLEAPLGRGFGGFWLRQTDLGVKTRHELQKRRILGCSCS